MTDDIEGELQEAPVEAPESEPVAEPSRDLDSIVERGIAAQRERGPDGKFVKSEGRPTDASPRGAAKGVATAAPANEPAPKDDQQPPKDAPTGHRPPAGFSVATKQAWDALPDHVKADIAKREADFEAGFKRFEGLGGFAHAAEKNGTTFQAAVTSYIQAETLLRQDPVAGVEFIMNGLRIPMEAFLQGLARKYGRQQQAEGQPPPQPQFDPNAIVAQAVEQARHGVRSEFQQEQINNDIAKFSSDPANRFFANVRQDMAVLVQAGKAADLQEAYQAACWLHPEIRAILIEEMKGGQDKTAVRTAARAQNAAKAVTGAPSSNSHAGEAPRRRRLSLDEEIEEGIRRQRGAA